LTPNNGIILTPPAIKTMRHLRPKWMANRPKPNMTTQCVVPSNNVRVPDVPMKALRAYVRVFCQMHTVKSMVEPGHPWFDHHMQRLEKAAQTLKQECSRRPIAKRNVRHFATIEAERWLEDCRADMAVRLSVLRSLGKGLPQVYEDRPV